MEFAFPELRMMLAGVSLKDYATTIMPHYPLPSINWTLLPQGAFPDLSNQKQMLLSLSFFTANHL